MKTIKALLEDIDAGGTAADLAIHELEVHAVIRDRILRAKVSDRLFRFAAEHAQEDQRVWGAIRRAVSMSPRSKDVVEKCKPFLSATMPLRVRQVTLQSLVWKGPFKGADDAIIGIVMGIVTSTENNTPSLVLGMNAVQAAIMFGIQDVVQHLAPFKSVPAIKHLFLTELDRMANGHRDSQLQALYMAVRNELDPPKPGVE